MATAAALSAASVARAVRDFLPGQPDVIIAAGGGVHNQAIMDGLEAHLPGIRIEKLKRFGLAGDAKEAVCFALLAHEAMNGVSCGMPLVTGASGRAFLGKIWKSGT